MSEDTALENEALKSQKQQRFGNARESVPALTEAFC